MARARPVAMILLPAMLLSCTMRDPGDAPDIDVAVDTLTLASGAPVMLKGTPPGVAACLIAECNRQADRKALDVCRDTKCGWTPATWSIEPVHVRYDEAGGTLSVQAKIGYAPARVDDRPVPRERPVHVGVTVLDAQGTEIDLAVQTLFPGALDTPLLFSAEVGGGIRDLIFGVWDRRIEPCDSSRMGCQNFGFVLDGPLASWPPTIYQDGIVQRIPPEQLTVRACYAGGSPEAYRQLRDGFTAAVARRTKPFGSEVEQAPGCVAASSSTQLKARYKNSHDQALSRLALTDAGQPHAASATAHDASLPTDLQLEIGGEDPSGARFACVLSKCTSRPESFDACLDACWN